MSDAVLVVPDGTMMGMMTGKIVMMDMAKMMVMLMVMLRATDGDGHCDHDEDDSDDADNNTSVMMRTSMM